MQGRYRDYFLAWAEEAERKLRGAEQAFWLEVLETEHDNLRQALAYCLADLARQEQERHAAQLRGAVTALREGIGAPSTPEHRERFDREVAAALSVLGDAVFDAAFAEGRTMTMEEAITYAISRSDLLPPG